MRPLLRPTEFRGTIDVLGTQCKVAYDADQDSTLIIAGIPRDDVWRVLALLAGQQEPSAQLAPVVSVSSASLAAAAAAAQPAPAEQHEPPPARKPRARKTTEPDAPKVARTDEPAAAPAVESPGEPTPDETGLDWGETGTPAETSQPAQPSSLASSEPNVAPAPVEVPASAPAPVNDAPSAAVATRPNSLIVEGLSSKGTLWEILVHMMDEGVPRNHNSVLAECLRWQSQVPLLAKIVDLKERVPRVMAARGITS